MITKDEIMNTFCLCTKSKKEDGWYNVQTFYDGYHLYCMHCGKLLK